MSNQIGAATFRTALWWARYHVQHDYPPSLPEAARALRLHRSTIEEQLGKLAEKGIVKMGPKGERRTTIVVREWRDRLVRAHGLEDPVPEPQSSEP